jgi:hypothetical protein
LWRAVGAIGKDYRDIQSVSGQMVALARFKDFGENDTDRGERFRRGLYNPLVLD